MTEIVEVTGKILFEIRDELRRTREDLKGEISGMKNDISGIKQDIQGIRSDINAIYGFFQHDIIKLASRVDRIEHKLELPPMT